MSSPSPLCDQLAAYVDGELEAAQADAFAVHLASCESCGPALHELLQLVALEAMVRSRPAARESADEPSPAVVASGSGASAGVAAKAEVAGRGDSASVDELARRRRRRGALIAIGAAAAAGIAGVWLVSRGGAPGRDGRADQPLVIATAETRSIEGRVSYPAADRYRRYDVARSGAATGSAGSAGVAADAVPLSTLSKLEDRGDVHGVAAALLLMNDTARAQAYLDRAGAGPDVAADRALIQRAAGHAADALITLDGALAGSPHHPQALWNRALVLGDLGLPLAAAAGFEAVAALGEPGWAEEARLRAKQLADREADRKAAFERLTSDGRRLASDASAVSPATARQLPGMTRLLLYDAIRSAESADAVRALAPLAEALDGVYGGRVLGDYVDRIAREDFAVRAPLARRYAQLVAGQALDAAAAEQLFAALRAAKQDDQLLGALFLASPNPMPAQRLAELSRLAEASRDPWFHLFAIEQAAAARNSDGDPAAAEALILPALAECARGGIDYRCAKLDHVLAGSYLLAVRLPDARRVIAEGWRRAARGGEWELERQFLTETVAREVLEDDVAATTLPLVRTYADELMRRDPSCDTVIWARDQIAIALIDHVDLDGARRELAKVATLEPGCVNAQPNVFSVSVKAHALRDPMAGSPADVAALRRQIAELRTQGGGHPRQAVLDQVEGRLLIDRDRPAGTALLEHAIAIAGPRPREAELSKARSFAYSILTLDAGRAGDWDGVWKLLGDDAGVAVPARCALGVAVEDRASLVVIRDATGASRGVFDGARPGPGIDAAALVGKPLVDVLRGCAEVDVVARPPVQGLPALLPQDIAWSYRFAATPVAIAAASAKPDLGRRLVITGALPPAVLALPPLGPWRSQAPADVVLDGAAATPSRVLAELSQAGYAEIHAHGMVDASQQDASFVMLSPEPDGRYALTARAIRQHPLRGRPVVVLAACHGAVAASYRHETWSLPAALVAAGARAVIASTDIISDGDAGAFFDDLRGRIAAGASPAVAMRDARTAWLAAHPAAAWVRSLMVFE